MIFSVYAADESVWGWMSSHANTSQEENVSEEPKIATVEEEKTLDASIHYWSSMQSC